MDSVIKTTRVLSTLRHVWSELLRDVANSIPEIERFANTVSVVRCNKLLTIAYPPLTAVTVGTEEPRIWRGSAVSCPIRSVTFELVQDPTVMTLVLRLTVTDGHTD